MPARRRPSARRVPISLVRSTTALLMVLPSVNSTMTPISMAIKPNMESMNWLVCSYIGFSWRKSSTVRSWPAPCCASRVCSRARAVSRSAVWCSCSRMAVTCGVSRPYTRACACCRCIAMYRSSSALMPILLAFTTCSAATLGAPRWLAANSSIRLAASWRMAAGAASCCASAARSGGVSPLLACGWPAAANGVHGMSAGSSPHSRSLRATPWPTTTLSAGRPSSASGWA